MRRHPLADTTEKTTYPRAWLRPPRSSCTPACCRRPAERQVGWVSDDIPNRAQFARFVVIKASAPYPPPIQSNGRTTSSSTSPGGTAVTLRQMVSSTTCLTLTWTQQKHAAVGCGTKGAFWSRDSAASGELEWHTHAETPHATKRHTTGAVAGFQWRRLVAEHAVDVGLMLCCKCGY